MTNDQNNRLQALLEQLRSGEISPDNEELVRLIDEQFASEDRIGNGLSEEEDHDVIDVMLKRIRHSKMEVEKKAERSRRVSPNIIKIAASIILPIVIGYGAYLFMPQQQNGVSVVTPPKVTSEPIDKPVLRLGDGSQVELDANNDSILLQGGARVQNQQGELSYENTESEVREVVFNEVITPRGGQYHLTLSDGSKVWLNGDSKINFPAVFGGDKRVVQLTGEAYFEIAHNESMPFHVITASGVDVRVLGTHFNVMAYEDEATINTTLLEGSVRVITASSEQMLVPGEQAQVSKSNSINLVKADISQALAWRDNKFIFRNADIQEIMRQLGRWYDLEVTYEGEVKDQFVLTLFRDTRVEDALEVIQLIGGVKFEIEGKKVKVIAL